MNKDKRIKKEEPKKEEVKDVIKIDKEKKKLSSGMLKDSVTRKLMVELETKDNRSIEGRYIRNKLRKEGIYLNKPKTWEPFIQGEVKREEKKEVAKAS